MKQYDKCIEDNTRVIAAAANADLDKAAAIDPAIVAFFAVFGFVR